MMPEESNSKNLYKVTGLILPLIIVFGSRSLSGQRVAGVVLTSYRVGIPLLFAVLSAKSRSLNRKTGTCLLKDSKHTICMIIVLLIWLLYGGLSLLLSPYSVLDTGAKELMSITLAAMSVICIVVICWYDGWNELMIGTKLAVAVTLVIAFYEIITGNHLTTSRFCSPEYYQLMKELFGENAGDVKFHLATSVFYNENDYSAFLAVFAPLFSADLIKKDIWMKAEGGLMLGLITYVIYVNDAFICLIAIIAGVACSMIIGHSNVREWISVIAIMITSSILAKLLSGAGELAASLLVQLNNRQNETGSLLLRLNTYTVTIRETFATSKGLGFGAGSYTNYFGQFVEIEKMMSNPHCFWFEILSEYGVLILLLFAIVLVSVFVFLIKANKKEYDIKYAMILGAGTSIIIASVAPSTYIQYAYYWIPIGMGLYLADRSSLSITIMENRKSIQQDSFDGLIDKLAYSNRDEQTDGKR